MISNTLKDRVNVPGEESGRGLGQTAVTFLHGGAFLFPRHHMAWVSLGDSCSGGHAVGGVGSFRAKNSAVAEVMIVGSGQFEQT